MAFTTVSASLPFRKFRVEIRGGFLKISVEVACLNFLGRHRITDPVIYEYMYA